MKTRIREILSERGISQKELAQGIGMSEIGLSKALNGSATRATIEKIASFLNVDAESLIVSEKLPHALYEGILTIGDVALDVAVLNDNTRVITQTAVFKALGRPARGNSRVINMPVFMDAANLQPFVDEQLASVINKIKYINLKGTEQEAYNAQILPLVSDLYLRARDAGVIKLPSQIATAKKAEMLVRSLARTGIVALVDEATGYDKEKNRAKDSLQKWLNTFLAEEASRWVKTFPDSFFEMIYKMYGWTWTNSPNKPGVVGNIINDWVYLRLGPKVLEELNRLNPKNKNGNRGHKHHQNLSEIVGKPALQRHLEALKALGAASNYDRARFLDMLNRAYPRPKEQFTFDFGDWE